jgi:hypothetical protein
MIAPLSLFAACASTPPPATRMASAEASVQTARDLGAEQVPSAHAQLRLAASEIQKAREMSKHKDNDEADSMLQRALADADLAIALTNEDNARNQAQRAMDDTERMSPAPDNKQMNPELEPPDVPVPEHGTPMPPEMQSPDEGPGLRNPSK